MILLLDIGNTNIKIGIAKDNVIVNKFIISSKVDYTSDELYSRINSFVNEDIDKVVVSNVKPKLTQTVKIAFETHYNITPIFLGVGVKTKLSVVTDNPKEVGADLIAGCVGAVNKYGKDVVVVDLGTATKFTCVENDSLNGVIICPGVEISLASLTKNGALLPDVSIAKPKKVLGTNTVECIQSGIYYQTLSTINGILDLLKKEYKNGFKTVLTGGVAVYFKEEFENSEIIYDDYLVLEGLLKIASYN